MKHTLAFLFVLIALTANAQPPQSRGQHGPPVLREVSNQQVAQSVFSTATAITKVSDYWYKIVDVKGKVLGYAANSSDYCKDVKGYANTTPVLVVTDKKFIVQKVALLSNYETESYIKRLETTGFFAKWNGKHFQSAKLETLDGYTGATKSAKAIAKNVDFLLENGGKKLPK